MIYVDDIMVVTKDKGESNYLVHRLKQIFHMTEESKDKYLGVNLRIDPVAGDVQLSLQRYCGQLVHKYNLDTRGPHLTVPITKDPNTEAEEAVELTQQEIRTYQGKVGSIMWAVATVRPDVQPASSKLAQGNKSPNEGHLDQVQRALKYLQGTGDLGLTFSRHAEDPLTLHGFYDANL
jgi:hypothetical protein